MFEYITDSTAYIRRSYIGNIYRIIHISIMERNFFDISRIAPKSQFGMFRYTHQCIFYTVYLRLQARTAIFLSARSRIPFGKICSLYGILGAFTGILRKKKRVSNPIFPKSATMTTTPISAFVYFC